MTTTINIARDYTTTPGARYPSDGPNSGEDFREKVLIPTFENSNKDIVVVERHEFLPGDGERGSRDGE